MVQALFLHGALLSRQAILPLLHHLPGDISWLVPDLAGHGQQRPHHQQLASLRPADLASDLLQRLPQLGQAEQPWVLVGHSLGALVALELCRQGVATTRLVLGDPPLWPCGDTPSQQEAQQALLADPIGQRLLADSFAGFDGALSYAPLLEAVAASGVAVDVLVGLRPRHQLAGGGWDCGTFVSDANRAWLMQWQKQQGGHATLQELQEAGHFVFHHASSLGWLGRRLGRGAEWGRSS